MANKQKLKKIVDRILAKGSISIPTLSSEEKKELKERITFTIDQINSSVVQ